MIEPRGKLSVRRQCKLLNLNRSSFYRPLKGESEENLALMTEMDKINYDEPTFGVLRIQDALKEKGLYAGEKRIRRLMKVMRIEAIYPKRNLSKLGHAQYKYPYLLRNLEVTKPNQVWAIDITFIPMEKGFMFLSAIIDVYSRYVVGWDISNTLAAKNQTDLLEQTIEQLEKKPEIINSDQGAQYTCSNWVDYLKSRDIKISMDGKGRATDNAFIERFFRSLKWDGIYVNPPKDGMDLYMKVNTFVQKYNFRSHQGISRMKPIELYQHFCVDFKEKEAKRN